MRKPKKANNKKNNPYALIVAGIVFACVGISMIFRPVTYYSQGGIGVGGRTPVISAFSGNDSAFIGAIFIFMAVFILSVAYKIKNS